MNVRKAIEALADDGKVTGRDGDVWPTDGDSRLSSYLEYRFLSFSSYAPFSPRVEPAADGGLIAEMKRPGHSCGRTKPGWGKAVNYCARMSRVRRVNP